MTIVPSIGTVSITLRIASTATRSERCRSPWPIVWAQAMAACSTTLRNSSERSDSMLLESDFCLLTAFSPVGRELATARAINTVAEHVISLHQLVDLPRALVNHGALDRKSTRLNSSH